MTQDYVTQKTTAALQVCGGNARDAALLLQTWCDSDAALQAQLVAPIMKNLCLLAVQRVATKNIPRQQLKASPPASEQALLQAIGNKNAPTMSSNRRSAAAPPRGSARHYQAVSTLAMAFKAQRPS